MAEAGPAAQADLVGPYAVDGLLEMNVVTQLDWGRITVVS